MCIGAEGKEEKKKKERAVSYLKSRPLAVYMEKNCCACTYGKKMSLQPTLQNVLRLGGFAKTLISQ